MVQPPAAAAGLVPAGAAAPTRAGGGVQQRQTPFASQQGMLVGMPLGLDQLQQPAGLAQGLLQPGASTGLLPQAAALASMLATQPQLGVQLQPEADCVPLGYLLQLFATSQSRLAELKQLHEAALRKLQEEQEKQDEEDQEEEDDSYAHNHDH